MPENGGGAGVYLKFNAVTEATTAKTTYSSGGAVAPHPFFGRDVAAVPPDDI